MIWRPTRGYSTELCWSILAIIASHRMGLRQRMLTTAELGSIDDKDLKSIMKRVGQITVSVEGLLAVVLFIRFTVSYGETPGRAAYSAVFHAVSAFNNAGISLNSDSLIPYASDWIVLLAMSAGFIIGGLGFPVIVDIADVTALVGVDRQHLDGKVHRRPLVGDRAGDRLRQRSDDRGQEREHPDNLPDPRPLSGRERRPKSKGPRRPSGAPARRT